MRKSRGIEEFSMSFLDVICCGFGAIILLLMITKTVEPIVLEKAAINLKGQVEARKNSIFEIRGQTKILERQIAEREAQLEDTKEKLAALNKQQTDVLGKFDTSVDEAEKNFTESNELASAKQTLTDEMQRLLGRNFQRTTQTVGGIPVDSEYIIFVIDTSGSMQSFSWPQVMNDMGDFMFSRYQNKWIEDSPTWRTQIINRLATWAPFSNSSPVEGIEAAINTYYSPDKLISIYVFGDDYTGDSIEEVVDTIDRINLADETGKRRVRIHAVGFPVFLDRPNGRIYRFAALMRELAHRNGGTFVGLQDFQ